VIQLTLTTGHYFVSTAYQFAAALSRPVYAHLMIEPVQELFIGVRPKGVLINWIDEQRTFSVIFIINLCLIIVIKNLVNAPGYGSSSDVRRFYRQAADLRAKADAFR
jgi:hypothetical protein